MHHIITPDLSVKATDMSSLLILILWTDPFQPASDWWTGSGCFTTVTDGVGG